MHGVPCQRHWLSADTPRDSRDPAHVPIALAGCVSLPDMPRFFWLSLRLVKNVGIELAKPLFQASVGHQSARLAIHVCTLTSEMSKRVNRLRQSEQKVAAAVSDACMGRHGTAWLLHGFSGSYNLDRRSRWKARASRRKGLRMRREATTRSGCTWGRRLKNLHPEEGFGDLETSQLIKNSGDSPKERAYVTQTSGARMSRPLKVMKARKHACAGYGEWMRRPSGNALRGGSEKGN